jgi:hypothetical protein
VVRHVFGVVLAKHQIFNSIVRPDAVDVMNNFVWFKVTTKMLLHNYAMFTHISEVSGKGMVRDSKKSVTSPMCYTALPSRAVLSGVIGR